MGALLAFCLGPLTSHCDRATAADGATPPLTALSPIQCDDLLRTERGDPRTLRRAADASMDYFRASAHAATKKVSSEPPASEGAVRSLREALQTGSASWRDKLCHELTAYRVGLPSPVLLTGYYRPVLPARRRPGAGFLHPLYGPPDQPVREPRAAINAGALAGRVPILAWLQDPIELFFLQVQGSGVLELDNGAQLHVAYAASNGRPYRSIGTLLVRQGKMRLEDVTMDSLKAYLREHPDERDEILHFNERYTFFREARSEVVGSLSVPLTAGRSVAADLRVYPPGAPAVLRVLGRAGHPHASPTSRLVFIQDAGAAIHGADRLDLYVGTGSEAGRIAGGMRDQAELYLLLPAEQTVPSR